MNSTPNHHGDSTKDSKPQLQDLRPRKSTFEWAISFLSIVVAVGIVIWAWNTSEVSPGTLVSNADEAVTYIFGRELSPEERERAGRSAERIVELQLRTEAEESVRSEIGVESGETQQEFDAKVDAALAREKSELGADTIEAMVKRAEARTVVDMRGGYFPMETRSERIWIYAEAILETLAIAVMGTLFAVIVAIPLSLFGASRSLDVILPGASRTRRFFRWLVQFCCRRVLDVGRGFNEFVLALILVAIIGLGPFAGVIALTIHGIGVLGKVIADALETISTGEIDGVTATGARPSQVTVFAVLPQVMPYIVSQSLLRFETNVRSAAVLGLVGAGGIGFLIDAKLKSYQYPEVATIMILIIVLVSLIDWACGRIMRKFV